jgi:hypothetical protein
MSPHAGWFAPQRMKRKAMFWTNAPTPRRFSSLLRRATSLVGLLAVLLTVAGCFFFRSKPDARVQELTSQLSPGLTMDEVLTRVGPPQRRGQNLFDKKKEYWIYEFVNDQSKKKKQSPEAERDGQDSAPDSELQLMFERGKLVNWNYASRN